MQRYKLTKSVKFWIIWFSRLQNILVNMWNENHTQSCLTHCDPMVYTVHGILLARILGWVAFPFAKGSSQPRDRTQVSRSAGGFFTSWATSEAQEYWSGLPIPSPVDLSDPGVELGSHSLQVDSLPTELWGKLILVNIEI